MNSSFARCAALGATLVAAALAGCSALAPVPDHTRFYTLAPAADAGQLGAVAPADAPVIGLRVAELAGHLRGPAMVVRSGEHELAYKDDHRWAGRLDDAIVRAVAAGVQRAAGSRINVVVTRPLRTAGPDVLIELDLLACEGRLAPESTALLIADWRVFHGAGDKPAASGRFRVEKPGWDGADYGRLAALLASATDDLAQAVGGPAIKIAGEPR